MTTNACIESLCNHRAALDLHIRGAAACAAANADAAASLCHHICIVFDGDILGIPSLPPPMPAAFPLPHAFTQAFPQW